MGRVDTLQGIAAHVCTAVQQGIVGSATSRVGPPSVQPAAVQYINKRKE